ncbi:gliding motility-associated peptidyl-prolyl isomerase GldI [Tenacibaculum sp. 190524A02b]|uniref:Peptidyl-prolyl cis-trans isomerase n=1 Tax=Tenacibaculum vairaonense TaxID=3137860 RepID=A0ABM9PN79_9FLAO
MKYKYVFLAIVISFFYGCKEPLARRPKKHGKQNFYREVIKKNKKLNDLQKKRIEKWIKEDTIHQYQSTTKGFWFYYNTKDTLNNPKPKIDDIVQLEYNVRSLNGDIIYENRQRSYKVDKQDFIPALQDGIKLMKKGETITFVIPSYRAYGVTGDGNKIGIHQPIQSTVKLIDIKTNK